MSQNEDSGKLVENGEGATSDQNENPDVQSQDGTRNNSSISGIQVNEIITCFLP